RSVVAQRGYVADGDIGDAIEGVRGYRTRVRPCGRDRIARQSQIVIAGLPEHGDTTVATSHCDAAVDGHAGARTRDDCRTVQRRTEGIRAGYRDRAAARRGDYSVTCEPTHFACILDTR